MDSAQLTAAAGDACCLRFLPLLPPFFPARPLPSPSPSDTTSSIRSTAQGRRGGVVYVCQPTQRSFPSFANMLLSTPRGLVLGEGTTNA